MQREVSLQLILGGLIFAGLTLLFAWMVLIPRGRLSPAAAQPVIERYMEAGRDDLPAAAHRLFSRAGLAETSLDQIGDRFLDRQRFSGYESLSIVAFEVFPLAGSEPSHQALVTAQVRYTGSQAPGRIDARLELEDDDWRIRQITLDRIAP